MHVAGRDLAQLGAARVALPGAHDDVLERVLVIEASQLGLVGFGLEPEYGQF